MKTANIKLSTIDDIRTLVDITTAYKGDVELSSGSYTIDAKSIMGIFGLDLSKPISITAFGDEPDELFKELGSLIITE